MNSPFQPFGSTNPSGHAASTAGASDANNSLSSAHRFLSRQEGFDSAKLSERTNELERRFGAGRIAGFGEEKKDGDSAAATTVAITNNATAAVHVPTAQDVTHLLRTSTSLSQLLSTHHEMCLQTAILNADRLERERWEHRVEERAALDWEGERKLILGGERFMSRSLVSAGAIMKKEDLVPKPQIVTPVVLDQLSFHLNALNLYVKSGKDGDAAVTLITSLREGVDNYSSTMANDSSESLHQYSNGLALLESFVLVNKGANNALVRTGTNEINIAKTVSAACRFFSTQFRTHMTDVVREVQLDGTYTSTTNNNLSPCARDASIFAEIVLGQNNGLWGALFYCLRCGDLNAAKMVLSATTEEVDSDVVELVNMMANMQGEGECIFSVGQGDDTTFGGQNNSLLFPSNSLTKARRVIGDLYEGVKTRFASLSQTEQPLVAYQAACLAMLSGSESISEASVLESSGLVKTVEDYLYASLWHALHLAEDVSSSEVSLKHTCKAVARLGSLVKEWGPSYFELDEETEATATSAVAIMSQGKVASNRIPRSGGWAYALPLLACQQFGTVLAYLAEVGGGLGLMQATHAGIVMDAVGINMLDYTFDSSNSSDIENSFKLLPMIVSSFSASLQGSDVVAALKYLVLLSGKGKIMNVQIQRLLLETRQFQLLAGKIEHDGTRSKAAMDEYFTSKEISSMLAEAASEAVRVGKSADGAELLVLAGRYGSLFSLMNREIASSMAVTAGEEFNKRQFWFNAAKQFHSIHLTGGKNYVQKCLTEEDNMSVGNTFQLLLNLVVFFDRHREQQWEGAWSIINDIALFPKSDSEMSLKMSQFNSLDSYLRREFHHIVLASMEVLSHLYRTAKQNVAGTSTVQHAAIDQRLNELLHQARLLVTFAGVINLSVSGDVNTYAKLAKLEQSMM